MDPILLAFAAACLALTACGGGAGGEPADSQGANFDGFGQANLQIGPARVLAWTATTFAQQAQGLRGVTAAQLAPTADGAARGMLFVFDSPVRPAFFMRDTGVALDLAWFRPDGTLIAIDSLQPYDETEVFPDEPVLYALEVPANTLAAFGVRPGDPLVFR